MENVLDNLLADMFVAAGNQRIVNLANQADDLQMVQANDQQMVQANDQQMVQANDQQMVQAQPQAAIGEHLNEPMILKTAETLDRSTHLLKQHFLNNEHVLERNITAVKAHENVTERNKLQESLENSSRVWNRWGELAQGYGVNETVVNQTKQIATACKNVQHAIEAINVDTYDNVNPSAAVQEALPHITQAAASLQTVDIQRSNSLAEISRDVAYKMKITALDNQHLGLNHTAFAETEKTAARILGTNDVVSLNRDARLANDARQNQQVQVVIPPRPPFARISPADSPPGSVSALLLGGMALFYSLSFLLKNDKKE